MIDPTNEAAPPPPVIGPWRKSTFSNAQDCVELAPTGDPDLVAVRNSNDHTQGTLLVHRAVLGHLLTAIKAGALDPLP